MYLFLASCKFSLGSVYDVKCFSLASDHPTLSFGQKLGLRRINFLEISLIENFETYGPVV